MLTDSRKDVIEQFDHAVKEAFPDGVIDMKFCVNENGTTEDAMNQIIGALRQYTNSETRPYMDY